ncbi:MAG TPA: molybdopterin-dependent oxidoreductase [Microvirga sp.]|nr:molybdopterin-dependent oxidoreductase [Microvirga sp.]
MRRLRPLIVLAVLLGLAPVSHAVEPLPVPAGPVLLTISGAIEATNAPGEARFDRAMLEGLGKASIRTHSVWSEELQHFEGVPLRAVIERVGAKGTSILATALNAYEVTIPLSDLQYDPLIAMRLDGRVLTLRDKGPLWIVYPRDDHDVLKDLRFDSRWIWNLNRLQVE